MPPVSWGRWKTSSEVPKGTLPGPSSDLVLSLTRPVLCLTWIFTYLKVLTFRFLSAQWELSFGRNRKICNRTCQRWISFYQLIAIISPPHTPKYFLIAVFNISLSQSSDWCETNQQQKKRSNILCSVASRCFSLAVDTWFSSHSHLITALIF